MKKVLALLLLVLMFAVLLPEARAAGEAAYRLSERTYRQLSSVHQLMQQQRYDEALAGLDRMRPRVEHKAHEHALLWQTYGYLFASTEQYQRAFAAATLTSPGNAHLLQGIAHYHLGQPARAQSSFERARAFSDSADQARQWISATRTSVADHYASAYSSD